MDKQVTEVGQVTESEDSSREGDTDQDLREQGRVESFHTRRRREGLSGNLTHSKFNSPPNRSMCQIRWELALPTNPYLKEQGRHQIAPCQASASIHTHHHTGL